MKIPVKTNRSLLMYWLLSFVTCGIYTFIFIHELAKDMNVIGYGDGQETAGLGKFIVFNILTCGIYSYIWYYQIAERLSINGPRYNVGIQETGMTVLLWMTLGSLLCGIGPLIGLYIIIKNANTVAFAYMAQN